MAVALPAGVPRFHVEGHSIDEDDQYAPIGYLVGRRRRRIFTAPYRTATIRWLLEPAALAAVSDWYEYDLEAGSLAFNAEIKDQESDALETVEARWINFSIQMLHLGRGLITGTLFIEPVPAVNSCTTWFLDNFTGVAADLETHTPDTAPSGFVWRPTDVATMELDGAGVVVPSTDASVSSGAWTRSTSGSGAAR